MQSPVIELHKVNKIYPGIHALHNLDFRLNPGEVHCLVGENGSGKSTLIKIISGIECAEPGSKMYIKGQQIFRYSAKQALDQGIQVIYQDTALFPNLSIRENIAFRNHFQHKSPFFCWRQIDSAARQSMARIGLDFPLHRKVSELSIAQQQLVEIARALTGELSLLILDEPTASLTRKEVNALFAVIQRLKQKGVAILFVSHKLNEIFEIAESVTIIRDGDKIGQFEPQELNHDKLVHYMTGQEELREKPAPPQADSEGQPLLRLQNLCRARHYQDVNLTLERGEILGITGLLGAGRTELALSLFGMNPPDSGKILLRGKEVTAPSNTVAMRLGMGYVPENRRQEGLIYDQSIADNLTITTLYQHLSRCWLLDDQGLLKEAQKWQQELGIKIPRLDNPVQTLSGGNQQKVVLAKWLALKPQILILDQPTVGIDVIAKNSIHSLVKKLAAQGMAIIAISDEVQELRHNCHRILIMAGGRIACEFRPEDSGIEQLLNRYNLA